MDLRNFKDLLRDEDGMGTVEVILIIVEIPTPMGRECFMWKIKGFRN